MWLLDITQLFQKKETNYYVFNPSIVGLGEDLYLVCYRVCKYDIAVKFHPWKIWDNGYKYFKNPHKVIESKFRNTLGPSFTSSWSRGCSNLPQDQSCYCTGPCNCLHEYDSTGLALVKFSKGKFELVHNINNVFGKEMNQDATLSRYGDTIIICYNSFERPSA